MESLTERHTKKGPSRFWLPDTGLENSVLGWEDHSPKFQMCFFLLFSALYGVTKFPIFCELRYPTALSNATSVFMARNLIYYLNPSCVWKEWRVYFSPSPYLHLTLPNACSFRVGSYIPVERTQVQHKLVTG